MKPTRITPASVFASLALTFFLVACGGGGGTGGSANPPPPTGNGGMRDLTSIQLSQQMSPAWNLGNSVNAVPEETSWGNPLVNQTLLNAVKAAGFKTVRIGAGWSQPGLDGARRRDRRLCPQCRPLRRVEQP
jgi:hypothetical protein